MRWAELLGLLALGTGCASPRPEHTLAAYRRALAENDARALWSLSDAATRGTATPEELAALLAEEDAQALRRSLERPAQVEERAAVVLEGGRRLELMLEDGEWRVAGGGVEPARFDTPAAALESFFRAVAAARWAAVRQAIPKRFAEALAGDAALRAQVGTMMPRIAAAREALAAVHPWPVRVDKDTAEIAYGEGRRVRLEREDGAWRVLDLE